jgi:hypothetical protein
MYNGLPDRMEKEITALAPCTMKVTCVLVVCVYVFVL